MARGSFHMDELSERKQGRQQQPANMKLAQALNPRAAHGNTLVMRSSPEFLREPSSYGQRYRPQGQPVVADVLGRLASPVER